MKTFKDLNFETSTFHVRSFWAHKNIQICVLKAERPIENGPMIEFGTQDSPAYYVSVRTDTRRRFAFRCPVIFRNENVSESTITKILAIMQTEKHEQACLLIKNLS